MPLYNPALVSIATMAALAQHNVVINGGCDVSQELGTTGATLANNTTKYIVDMGEAMYNHGAATAVVTSAQLAAASFPTALPGFPFGQRIQATTAISSPANGDFALHRRQIEGYRVANWGWGASGAAQIVYAFQFYSTASGVAFAKFSNASRDRIYYVELTVAAGWNFFSGTIAGDTAGSWPKGSTVGLIFEVFSAGKAAAPVAPNAWTTTNTTQTTNSTNLLGTNNNLTILTGLYIDAGAQLPVAADLPLLMRPFAAELSLCHRYYWTWVAGVTNAIGATGGNDSTTVAVYMVINPVPMRATPAWTCSNVTHFSVYQLGGLTACTNLVQQGSQGNNITFRLTATVAAGLTAGAAGFLYSNTSAATMFVDARLV